jgi:integrase
MKTHSNNGRISNVVERKGLHIIKKTLADGSVATYYRHRPTGEKLPAPGSAAFEAKWAELEALVGKQRTERATLAGLIDTYTTSDEYDLKVTSKSHRDNDRRIFAQIKATRVTDDKGNVLPAVFGDTPISMLLDKSFRSAIMTYRTQLKQQRVAAGKSLREVDAHMTALCALFAWAVEQNKLDHHPIGKYKKLYQSERANAVFDEDQIGAWLHEVRKGDAAHKCRELELVFLLALTLGQRAGDLRSLLWGDYVIDRVTGARGFNIWPLKTRAKMGSRSAVFVPVLPFVGDILDAMRGEPTAHVLTLNGRAWMPRTLSYYFSMVTRDANAFAMIEGKDARGNRTFKQLRLHMHDLRGTAITWLAIAGCSEREIASITGHSIDCSAVISKYVAADTRIAVGAIARLARLPEVQRLQAQFTHLALPAPLPQLTYQPQLVAAE